MLPFPDWFYKKNGMHVSVAKVCWGHAEERIENFYRDWLEERMEEGRAKIKAKLEEDLADVDFYDEVLGG